MWSDEQGSASRRFFYSAIFWLLVPGLIGLFLATFLYVPSFYDNLPLVVKPYLSFGRLRPTHVNIMLYGWLSPLHRASAHPHEDYADEIQVVNGKMPRWYTGVHYLGLLLAVGYYLWTRAFEPVNLVSHPV